MTGFAAVDQALFGHELVEQLRFGGQRAEAAADDHAEAALAVANHGAQADVVDRAQRCNRCRRSRRRRT